jgi:mannose/fructose/sorbose-specific phosphotransferase system IID component
MTESRAITKKDLMGVFYRSFTLQASWNYERMQAGGWLFIVLPVLQKLYKGNPEGLKKAAARNLEFFNTQPYLASPILGVALALEERVAINGDVDASAVSAIKMGMMGPFAGLGDSMFWFTIRPICLGIGISLAAGGSIVGPIVFLLIYNVFHLGTRYFGTMESYKLGLTFMSSLAKGGVVQRISELAGVLGLTVLGVMIAQNVSLPFIFKIGNGAAAKTFVSIANSIMPNIMGLGVTFLFSYFLKKGITPVRILYAVLVVCLLFAYFKIF